jgi:hypothetical protein
MTVSVGGRPMTYQVSALALVVVLLLFSSESAIFVPQPTSAEVQSSNVHDIGAGGYAQLYSEKDGVHTRVQLFVIDESYRQDSNTDNNSYLTVEIVQYKIGDCGPNGYGGQYCWRQYVPISRFYAYGDPGSNVFKMKGDKQAMLNFTMTGFETRGYDSFHATNKTITMVVNWNATEQPARTISSYHYFGGDNTFSLQGVSVSAQANATANIRGDITMDLRDSQWSEIFKFNKGELHMAKY